MNQIINIKLSLEEMIFSTAENLDLLEENLSEPSLSTPYSDIGNKTLFNYI